MAAGVTDFAQLGAHIFIFLRVVVARNPPRSDIARHSELGKLVGHGKLFLFLLREKIAEAHTVVIHAEFHIELRVLLPVDQLNSHTIVIVAD